MTIGFRRVFGLAVASILSTGAMLTASVLTAVPAAAQSGSGLPAGQSLEEPTEFERDFPRLPPGFDVREPAEPDALYEVTLEGYTGPVYQSNVYRSPSDETSDVLWIAAPRARLIHDGPSVDTEIAVEAEVGIHFNESRNDYEDFSAGAGALWGERDKDFQSVAVQFGRDHSAIGADIDDPEREAAEVTKYWRAEFLYQGSMRFDDFLTAPQVRLRNYEYENSRRLDGTPIDNDGKSRTEIDGNLRLGWQFQPDLWFLVDPGLNWRLYDRDTRTQSNFDRDSFGLRPRVGVLSGTPQSELFAIITAGLATQTYDDDRLDTVSVFGFLGEIGWRLSDDQMVSLDVERDIGETTLSGASAAISTRARVRYSHLLTDQIGIRVGGEIEERDFEVERGLRPNDRTDDIYKVGGELNYRFSKVGFAAVAVDYVERDSTDPTVEFDGIEVSARIGARF